MQQAQTKQHWRGPSLLWPRALWIEEGSRVMQTTKHPHFSVCGAIRVVSRAHVCPWAPAVRRPLSPGPDMSPIHPAVSLSVSHTHTRRRPRPEPKANCPSSHTRAHSPPHSHTHTGFSVIQSFWHRCTTSFLAYCGVCVCVGGGSVGHSKSSVLPLIVLISSLGAAGPHSGWPLSLLWKRALLT